MWGTAKLALDEAAKVDARDCAVIGCGVIGLSTARLLQLHGYKPVIYTRVMTPTTTSNIAGGLWEPVSLYDADRVAPEFRRQLKDAAQFAFHFFQSFAGEQYGVRCCRCIPFRVTARSNLRSPTTPQATSSPYIPSRNS